MKFLKEEAARLKEPSGSTFILLMSDWAETSWDIFSVCWHLRDAKRGGGGRTSPASRALLAPWAGVLINLEDTIALDDLESGKIIPIRASGVESKATRSVDCKALNQSSTKNAAHRRLQLFECPTHPPQISCSTASNPFP